MGRKAKGITPENVCIRPQCSRPIKARGLCMHHYCEIYSQGQCVVPGCLSTAKSKRMCERHYKQASRTSLFRKVVDDLSKTPTGPYVTDCSETSSYCDESYPSSRAATPRGEVCFALYTEKTDVASGDVPYDVYRALCLGSQAARKTSGDESSPSGYDRDGGSWDIS